MSEIHHEALNDDLQLGKGPFQCDGCGLYVLLLLYSCQKAIERRCSC
jgi:hypothetical protein